MIKKLKHKYQNYIEKRKKLRLLNDINKNVITLKQSELIKSKPVVLCLFKNGSYFIDSFIKHYQNIGFNNFVFLNNNSDDDSIELLEKHNVTIINSGLSYKKYKWAFKQFLVHQYGKKHLVSIC